MGNTGLLTIAVGLRALRKATRLVEMRELPEQNVIQTGAAPGVEGKP
jgi:hypothetical protein